jgi:putative tricarboxylic transport membrane protein
MFDGLIAFGHSIWSFCDPLSLGLILLSSLVGVVIGALPGLTATMGVALMTTLTIKMPSNQALLVLICTYVGAIYGGSRSAILLNIPGTPASAASCLDGYALAKQGLAGRAMGIATSGSVLGTLIGMFFLALFTPILGNLALKFGAYEFFWLALFGVIIAGTLTGDDPLKGWIAGLVGVLTATVGQESIYAYDRFSFGSRDLAGARTACAGENQPVRLGDSEAQGCHAVLAHDPALRRHRHVHRHPAGRGRRRRRVVVVRRRQAREQGEGEVRQGLDRRADGGRDRR